MGAILVSLTFLLVFAVLVITTLIIMVIVLLRKQKHRRDRQSDSNSSIVVNETINDVPIYELLDDEHALATFPMTEITNGPQNNEEDVLEPYVFTTCSAYEL